MSIYQRLTGRTLPENSIILPIHYQFFGTPRYCIIFVQAENDLGKGASKRVDQVYVKESIGRVHMPKITLLKGERLVLYRPRKDFQIFINDLLAIMKLKQMLLRKHNVSTNIVKINGFSFYPAEEDLEAKTDYSRLLYGSRLKFSPDIPIFLKILQASVDTACSDEMLRHTVKELLHKNILIDTPFMIGEILPFSLVETISQMPPDVILHNLYQMVNTIAAYAAEGVYFRDLQPDNFRVSPRGQVKLIDPSYITTVHPDRCFALFIKQTTPEYLPNVFSDFYRHSAQEKLMRYFGEFTEGVCIGMLERVLRRIFLPQYMGAKYDKLYRQPSPHLRIETANQLKLQEDLDLFQDVVEEPPSPHHFARYQNNLASFLRREGVVSETLIIPLSRLLTVLRQFSYPIFASTICHSLLNDDRGNPVAIEKLPDYIQTLGIIPLLEGVRLFSPAKFDGEDVIFEDDTPGNQENILPAVKKKSIKRTVPTRKAGVPPPMINTVIEFIHKELPEIKSVLHDSHVLDKMLRTNLRVRSLEEMQTFFRYANDLFRESKSDLSLRHEARSLVPNGTPKRLERHSPAQYRQLFRSIPVAQKCQKLLQDYLINIARGRFLCALSLEYNIRTFLPKPNEDVLEFIAIHSFITLQELAKTIAITIGGFN